MTFGAGREPSTTSHVASASALATEIIRYRVRAAGFEQVVVGIPVTNFISHAGAIAPNSDPKGHLLHDLAYGEGRTL